MAKPSILVIPGAWQVPFHYLPLEKSLTSLGYQTSIVKLATNKAEGPYTETAADDVNVIQAAISAEAGQGNEVVLVMHSYGGVPGGEACKGFLAQDFAAKGQKGGVKGLVFIAAMVMPVGAGLPDELKDHPEFDINNETNTSRNRHPLENFYMDVPEPLQSQAVAAVVPQSAGVYSFISTFSPWEHVPAHYIITENDVSTPVEFMKMMIQATSEKGRWTQSSIATGHSAQLVKPEETAGLVGKFVEGI